MCYQDRRLIPNVDYAIPSASDLDGFVYGTTEQGVFLPENSLLIDRSFHLELGWSWSSINLYSYISITINNQFFGQILIFKRYENSS